MKKRYLLLSGTSAFISGYLLTRFIHEKRKTTKESLDDKYIAIHENGMFEIVDSKLNNELHKTYGIVLKIKHRDSDTTKYAVILENSEKARMKAISMYARVFSNDVISNYDITTKKLDEIVNRLFLQQSITNNRKEDEDEFYKV